LEAYSQLSNLQNAAFSFSFAPDFSWEHIKWECLCLGAHCTKVKIECASASGDPETDNDATPRYVDTNAENPRISTTSRRFLSITRWDNHRRARGWSFCFLIILYYSLTKSHLVDDRSTLRHHVYFLKHVAKVYFMPHHKQDVKMSLILCDRDGSVKSCFLNK
jgi:hypothetical protein